MPGVILSQADAAELQRMMGEHRRDRLRRPLLRRRGPPPAAKEILLARAQENPTNRTYLICKVDDIGPDIDVYFEVHGGGNLDTAGPRIQKGDWIPAKRYADGVYRATYNLGIGKEWP